MYSNCLIRYSYCIIRYSYFLIGVSEFLAHARIHKVFYPCNRCHLATLLENQRVTCGNEVTRVTTNGVFTKILHAGCEAPGSVSSYCGSGCNLVYYRLLTRAWIFCLVSSVFCSSIFAVTMPLSSACQ